MKTEYTMYTHSPPKPPQRLIECTRCGVKYDAAGVHACVPYGVRVRRIETERDQLVAKVKLLEERLRVDRVTELEERLRDVESMLSASERCRAELVETVRRDDAALARLEEARFALAARLNAPEILNFVEGVKLEVAHQRERWGSDHDAGKSPSDWFWLLGYLSGKALHAAVVGDRVKALHHTISSAAALANWHAALLGANNEMRPGIGADKQSAADGLSAPAER